MEFKNFKPVYIVESKEELRRLEQILEVLDRHTECREEEFLPIEILVKKFMDDGNIAHITIYPQEGVFMPRLIHSNQNRGIIKDLFVGFGINRGGYDFEIGKFSYWINRFPLSAEKYEREQWKKEDTEFASKYPNSFSKIKSAQKESQKENEGG